MHGAFQKQYRPISFKCHHHVLQCVDLHRLEEEFDLDDTTPTLELLEDVAATLVHYRLDGENEIGQKGQIAEPRSFKTS